MNRKQKIKRIACCAAMALFVALPSAALRVCAASPDFARTEEEWATLRDNRLEWSEIPDLVEEYNATIKKEQAELDNDKLHTKSSKATTDALVSMADEYDSLAAEAEGTTGGALTAASYRVMAEQLRSQADENVSDYRILQLEFERVRKQLAKNAQDLFVEYHRSNFEKTAADKQATYLDRACQSAQNLQLYGLGTQLETLTALESLQKAQASQASADALVQSNYKQLITMCGWKYDAAAEVGGLPELDLAAIDARDAAADLRKAQENSLTLKEDTIKIENAKAQYGSSVVTKWEDQLAADQNSVKTGYQSASDALSQARKAYDSAVSTYQVKAEDLAKAARQLNLGSISQMEYLAAENAMDSAQAAKESAYCDLVQKKAAYDAFVEGLS